MGKKIKIKSGKMSIDVDAASRDIFLDVLEAIPGDTVQILEKATEDIKKRAYNKWPVRKPVSTDTLTEEGKVRVTARTIAKKENDYTLKRALAASYKMQRLGTLKPPEFQIKSKGSKEKLYTAFVFSRDTLEAVVGNSAPYAWAIKVGKDTDLRYKEGTRIASKLLWEPAKRRANTIASKMADASIAAAKKVK